MNKGSHMNCWEQKFIQEYHRSGKLITEQQTCEYNPLFAIAEERNEKQNQSYPELHSNNKIRQDLTHTLQQVKKTNNLNSI